MNYKKCLFVLLFLIFILCVSSVSAIDLDGSLVVDSVEDDGVFCVGNDQGFDDIQSLVDGADPGDVIELDGLYTGDGTPIVVDKDNLTFVGVNNATLDANCLSNIFNISANNTVFYNILFVNGQLSDESKGGAIYTEGITEINNCSFVNNMATRGGAVYSLYSYLSLNNCSFVNNSACIGGAVYSCGSNSNISDCCFVDNFAVDNAGALKLIEASYNLSNCSFVNNSAGESGSAIGLSDSFDVSLCNCSFVNNMATRGGAVFTQSSDVSLCDCSFVDNSASYGGAILINDGTGDLCDCSFVDNSAEEYGGAVYTYYSDVSLCDCCFVDNSVEEFGGAVYTYYSDVSLCDCSFVNNSAGVFGGAVFTQSSDVSLCDCSFVDNSAGVYGGAILINDGTGDLCDCCFVDNSASYGGAILIYDATGDLCDCCFVDNSASYGGAVFTQFSCINLTNCSFVDNSADFDGGAVDVFDSSDSLYDCSFVNNSANNGGGLYVETAICSVVNCSFDGNLAKGETAHGGAIGNLNNYGLNIVNSTIVNNKVEAKYGVGSAIVNQGYLNITNSTIINNQLCTENKNNETIYNIQGKININNSIIENNTCTGNETSLLYGVYRIIVYDDLIFENYTLPSKYDLRNITLDNGTTVSYVTSIKNQEIKGPCWAFSNIACLESYLLQFNNTLYDFSENNMKNIMGNYSKEGFDRGPNEGATIYEPTAYLVRWSGPVNESDDPFNATSVISPTNLTTVCHVQDIVFLPVWDSVDDLKLALLNYGAIDLGIYAANRYVLINETCCQMLLSFSNTPCSHNHGVSLVGWDDSYPGSNFGEGIPDGAFIIKNSWGEHNISYGIDFLVGDHGYFYISYYDYSLSKTNSPNGVFANVEGVDNYKMNYQYDPLGNVFNIGYGNETAWFANQFISQGDNSLAAFSLYTYAVNSSYEAYIYVNDELKGIQSGNILNPGYSTIKLDDWVDLSTGDVFKVAVKLTTPGCNFPIPLETQLENYTSKAHAELGQSFISPDGINWYDIAQNTTIVYVSLYNSNNTYLSNSNVCLKAFTANTVDTLLNVSDLSVKAKTDDTLDVILFDVDGNSVVNRSVLVSLTNQICAFDFNVLSDENGVAHLDLGSIPAGTYDVNVVFAGDKEYTKSRNSSKLSISPLKTSVDFDVVRLGYGKYLIEGKVFDEYGNPVNQGYVDVVADKIYPKIEINPDGTFKYIIQLPRGHGLLDVTVNYTPYSELPEPSFYASSNKTVKEAIKPYQDSVKPIKTLENTGNPIIALILALSVLPILKRKL